VPLQYDFNTAAPISIQLTPNEDAYLQQQLNDPNTHPKVQQRALAIQPPHNAAHHPASRSFSDATTPPPSTTSNDGTNTATTGLPMAKHPTHPKITPEVQAHPTTLLAEDRS
jgi:hypothetical protein